MTIIFHGLLLSLLASSWASPYRVGLVLDRGGKDDRSFNASAYAGGKLAVEKLGVDLKTVESSDDHAYEGALRSLAKKEYQLVIAIGVAMADAVSKVAPLFPNTKFAVVDAIVEGPNVKSLMFKEQEGSYLMGVAAALKTKTGKIGFVGGMDIPLIRRFEMGYIAGAKHINPHIKTMSQFVGLSVEAWNNPTKAKELALTQFQSGVDIIFAAAGASGQGVFDAASEQKKFAIGTDSNQNWIKPGVILSSMLKRVDLAVFNTIQEASKGVFSAGVSRSGLAEGGIDYALDEFNRPLLLPDMLKTMDEIKKQISSKKIAVPDFYLNKSSS